MPKIKSQNRMRRYCFGYEHLTSKFNITYSDNIIDQSEGRYESGLRIGQLTKWVILELVN